MNFKDYFILPTKFMIWNKASSIIIIIFLTLLFLLGNILINVGYNYDKYVNDSVNTNILARTYFIFSEEQLAGENVDLEKIVKDVRKISHVVHSYNDQYATIMNASIKEINNEKTDNVFWIKTVTDTFSPNISIGKSIENANEIICPRYLRLSEDATKTYETVDMKNFLNKDITLWYPKLHWENSANASISQEFTKTVTLVGIYENVFSVQTYNECYMLEDVVRSMFLESQSTYDEKWLENNTVYTNGTATGVVVDSLENLDIVKQDLEDAGYYVSDVGLSFDWEFINSVKAFSICGFFSLLVLILIIFIIYINIYMRKQRKQIAIYKTFGYNDKQISKIFWLNLLFSSILAFIFSLIILQIIVLIANNIISEYMDYFYVRFQISIFFEFVFLLLLFCILYFLTYKINKKVCSYTVREILHEDNI